MSTAGLSKARLGRLHDVMDQDKFDALSGSDLEALGRACGAIEVRLIDMFDQPERTN